MHPEDRQVDRAGGVHSAAGAGDLLGEQGGFGDAEAVAAVLLGDGHPEPTPVGDGLIELGGELVRLIFFHPVVVVELRRELSDRLSDQFLIVGQFEAHSTAGHDNSPLVRC